MIQSIERAFSVLDYLVLRSLSGEGVPLQDIARHLDVAAPTAHNILKTMVGCGYVGRDDHAGYTLGPRCRDIARGSVLAGGLIAAATGAVHALAERTGESVVLATLVHGKRLPVLRAEGQSVVRVATSVETGSGFWGMVTGRVLAAWADAQELGEIMDANGLPGEAWGGIETEPQLTEALGAVRQDGHAAQVEEDRGVAALAVPVFEPGGRVLAALGVYLPSMRANPARMDALLADARETADRLGRQAVS